MTVENAAYLVPKIVSLDHPESIQRHTAHGEEQSIWRETARHSIIIIAVCGQK